MNLGIPIELDKIILIGNYPKFKVNNNSEIETRWLLIKGINNKIFCLKSNELEASYSKEFVNKIKNSEYEIVDLQKRIKGRIKEIINKELNNIFQENLEKEDLFLDYDIKEIMDFTANEKILIKDYKLIDEAYRFGSNMRNDEYKIRNLDLEISEIEKGIVSVGETDIKYNLFNDKFLNTDQEILRKVYRDREIRHIISYEKYKQGIGSKFYSEIAKINEFIQDKQSVTVKLKNGTIFKTPATIRNILNVCSNGEIFISRIYKQKIIEGQDFNDYQYKVNELESLKFGKEELKVNSENLIIEGRTKEIENLEETEEEM